MQTGERCSPLLSRSSIGRAKFAPYRLCGRGCSKRALPLCRSGKVSKGKPTRKGFPLVCFLCILSFQIKESMTALTLSAAVQQSLCLGHRPRLLPHQREPLKLAFGAAGDAPEILRFALNDTTLERCGGKSSVRAKKGRVLSAPPYTYIILLLLVYGAMPHQALMVLISLRKSSSPQSTGVG